MGLTPIRGRVQDIPHALKYSLGVGSESPYICSHLRTHLRRRKTLILLACHICHGLKPLPAGGTFLHFAHALTVLTYLGLGTAGTSWDGLWDGLNIEIT